MTMSSSRRLGFREDRSSCIPLTESPLRGGRMRMPSPCHRRLACLRSDQVECVSDGGLVGERCVLLLLLRLIKLSVSLMELFGGLTRCAPAFVPSFSGSGRGERVGGFLFLGKFVGR